MLAADPDTQKRSTQPGITRARTGLQVGNIRCVNVSRRKVDSVYLRMIALHPDTKGHVSNGAEGGAVAAMLVKQARYVLGYVPKPSLVIIQTIDNDIACDGTDAQHIPVFGTQVLAALKVITTSSPHSKILIVGQFGRPATYLKALTTPDLRESSSGTGPCSFYEPDGTFQPKNVAYLTSIIKAYQAEQAKECAKFPQCSTDNGVMNTYVDKASDFADANGNHLTAHGLSRITALIWPTVHKLLT